MAISLKIVLGENMGKNPASVNLDTKVCKINPTVWKDLSATDKELILLHEAGHININSTCDEIGSDRYALSNFAGSTNESLRKSVASFLRILSKANVDEMRQIEIIKSALRIDYEKFGNKQALDLLNEIDNEQKMQNNRQANTAGTAAKNASLIGAAVSAGSMLISLGTQFLWGKRNDWAKSGKKGTRNAIREDIIKAGTQTVIGGFIEQYATSGEAAIYAMLDDRTKLHNQVHSKLYSSNVWKDSNIFTNNYAKSDKFFKDYTWVKAVIDSEVESQRKKIRALFKSLGYDDPNEKKGNYSFLLYAICGVLGVVLIYKLLT